VGPSARTREGALLERWLAQCGVTGPLYTIARRCVFAGAFVSAAQADAVDALVAALEDPRETTFGTGALRC
jgi:hypothetical protein